MAWGVHCPRLCAPLPCLCARRGFGRPLGRDFGGLGEQGCIFLPEDLGAEADGRIDLRLPERQIPRAGGAQAVEQRLRAGVEVLLDLVIAARRHLADGELAGIVAAGADELDQRLGIVDVA